MRGLRRVLMLRIKFILQILWKVRIKILKISRKHVKLT